jgi:single-stranded DNA-binding protein
MAGETIVTVVGNLTGDPELRFLPNGAAVAFAGLGALLGVATILLVVLHPS